MAHPYNMDSPYSSSRTLADDVELDSHFSNIQRPHQGTAQMIQMPQLHSLPAQNTSTICQPSPTFSPKNTQSLVNDRSAYTDTYEQRRVPLQSEVISPYQQRTSPDHCFRPLLPKPVSTTQYSRPATLPPTSPSHYALPRSPWAPAQNNAQDPHDHHQTQYSTPTTHHPYDPAISPRRETIPPITQLSSPAPAQHHPPRAQPNRWQQAREYRRRIYEPPSLDPSLDPTIASVRASAETWITHLIHAMTNTSSVKDTPASHHRRLFLSPGLDPLLIEAACREIFTVLLDRCENGFRGPAHFNKALKTGHKLEPDRTATCEERLRNVVKVLAWNKRACKDVLYEDWKIRLLVNHPLAYDREKDAQKGSNDQRRRRQLEERERMERTEEELRAWREGGGGAALGEGEGEGGGREVGELVRQADGGLEWAGGHDARRCGGVGGLLGKRAAFDQLDGSDSKRRRV